MKQTLKNYIKIFLVICLLSFSVMGCITGGDNGGGNNGGGNNGGTAAKIVTLGTSSTAVSALNSSTKYTLITALPGSKPQGDSAFNVSKYSFTLQSSTTNSNQAPANDSEIQIYNARYPSEYDKQWDLDRVMRNKEQTIFKNGTQQLEGNRDPVAPAPPNSISVGTAWNNVKVYNISNQITTISTTCRAVSNEAYFFVDNRDTNTMSRYLDGYKTAFKNIYNTDRAKFGEQSDVDKNGKVIIVFSRALSNGLLGYFNPDDKYPNSSQYPDSNQGDIFYVTTTASYQGKIVNETLAHEFQHMIFFDQRAKVGVRESYAWLTEALSQAAEYYNGFTDAQKDWIGAFLSSIGNGSYSTLSLTHWTNANYGFGAIFIRYMIDQYGDKVIKNMCCSRKDGIDAVEAAVKAVTNSQVDFNTIFANFSRAVAIGGSGSSADSIYMFKTLNLGSIQTSGRGGLLPTATKSAGGSLSGSVLPYSLNFVKWTGSLGSMTLTGNSIKGTALGLVK